MRTAMYHPAFATEKIPVQKFHKENKLSFEIRTTEWLQQHMPQVSKPHRHDYYELVWIITGSGTIQADMEQYEIAENTVYRIKPGQVHSFSMNEGTKGYILSFSNEFLYLSDEKTDAVNVPTVIDGMDEDMVIEMGIIARQMTREFDNYLVLRSEILKGLLKIFLMYLTRHTKPVTEQVAQSRNKELTAKFFSLLEKNFMTSRMVTDYAGELAVTPNYLNEIVKKVSGFAASYHIQQRIVLEAKRHATYSDASMKEIAYHLGFDDVAHFSKFFKNVSGSNFTDFKKSITSQVAFA